MIANYPTWVCEDCAKIMGARMPDGHCATFHPDTCDVCGQWKSVTEPRDFGHFSESQLRFAKSYYESQPPTKKITIQ